VSDISALQPGAIFGRDFRIVRALRRGGMGSVYVVEQLSTGKPRALKVMSPELAQSQAARERFVLEARAASRIESDHVVEIVTAGVDEATGAPFLVMELLKGEELAESIQRIGPLPLADAVEVLTQVGHALEHAHAQGIVHRDIKPENVFLQASRRKDVPFRAKILDFGIAKLAAEGAGTGTQPLGTPLFMAPEQTERKGKIAPSTDVWALGLLAFRMLTGRHYWLAADGGTLAALLREMCVEDLPSASARAQELGVDRYLPPGFDAWFGQCVNRDLEARFQEAGAAVRAFAELAGPSPMPSGKLVIEAPPTNVDFIVSPLTADRPGLSGASNAAVSSPLGAPVGAPTPAPVVSGDPQAPPPAAGKGNRWVLIVLAPVAAALGGGLFFLLRDKMPDPASEGGAGTASATVAAPSPQPSASPGGSAAAAAPACPDGMVLIPSGKMFMGARDLTADSKPPHEVSVGTFCLDKTEVTTAAYLGCVSKGECERPLDKVSWADIKPDDVQRYSRLCNGSHKDRGDHPVNCVAWAMADTFCRKRSARLPTEAEWEFAARGSSQRKYPWGDEEPDETRLNACGGECAAWGAANGDARKPMYSGNDGFVATAPVGSFPKGAASHGVMDLAGNVWEWTSDWYAPYTDAAAVDPRGPAEGKQRVLRGGDFFGANADWARPAFRWKTDPETYNHAIGFRCAADAKGK
jgi:formylglycine-generating enzyme required for sulfatase activity/serine/threonine protein kinase